MYYVASGVGGARNIPCQGIDTLNHYFMHLLVLASELKANRFDFKQPPFTEYQSKLDEICDNYKGRISELLKTKRLIIGRQKSKKYNYNFVVDLHNEPPSEGEVPTRKMSAMMKYMHDKYDTTLVFFDYAKGIEIGMQKVKPRLVEGASIFDILH
jgi:hypothetical protein